MMSLISLWGKRLSMSNILRVDIENEIMSTCIANSDVYRVNVVVQYPLYFVFVFLHYHGII